MLKQVVLRMQSRGRSEACALSASFHWENASNYGDIFSPPAELAGNKRQCCKVQAVAILRFLIQRRAMWKELTAGSIGQSLKWWETTGREGCWLADAFVCVHVAALAQVEKQFIH